MTEVSRAEVFSVANAHMPIAHALLNDVVCFVSRS
jgi:hypothetical protein